MSLPGYGELWDNYSTCPMLDSAKDSMKCNDPFDWSGYRLVSWKMTPLGNEWVFEFSITPEEGEDHANNS